MLLVVWPYHDRFSSDLQGWLENYRFTSGIGLYGALRSFFENLKAMQSSMLDEYNPFSSDTTFLDQVISDLIDETIEARGIVPGGFEIEVSELTLSFCW